MNENVVAKILFTIGVIQIGLGLILGFALANVNTNLNGYYQSVMDWSLFFGWAFGGFVSGMLFIGFYEIIKLLHKINEKMPAPNKNSTTNNAARYLDTFNQVKQEERTVDWNLGESDKEKVNELYETEDILEIIPSHLENYCLVKLQNTHGQYISIVDVGGFGAQEIHDEETKRRIMDWYNGKNEI
ncbi:hypothetical protein ACFQ3N_19485 [Virgibacillus byunsanensis]|uniref:Uncharacterized protein n=1 Tax=Virgibacillus byunsanensis TaxID=570945 RepID=A0ABW3LR33_9BACI